MNFLVYNNGMNILIFNFFFSLSTFPVIAWSALFISDFLIYFFILGAILIPILTNRDYAYAVFTSLVTGGTWLITFIIKNIFMIPRPFVTMHLTPLYFESGFSFPSSHVTVATAIAVLIWNKNRKLGIIFAVFAILTALSRMVIGVHYPTDIIGGFIVGLIISLTFIKIFKK